MINLILLMFIMLILRFLIEYYPGSRENHMTDYMGGAHLRIMWALI